MIDYEFKIRLLEKDLQHYREMQALMRERMDTHQLNFDHIAAGLIGAGERLARIEAIVEATTANINTLSAKIDKLVDAMLRNNPNGH
jgi:hypothetical protein